ncbi:MAG TPA: TonB-dependent receptor [Azospirillaceae bacterium]|nr:TonB-dependent receptor [Azospirillaceae bacterium]
MKRMLSPRRLLAGTAFVALASSGMLAAGIAAAQETGGVEEIVVTGSRIARDNATAPTPLQVVGEEALQARGTTNAADYLNQLPSLGVPTVSQTNSNFTTTAAGLNLINLRNLGTERTLVLVNGRRHVGGTGGSNAVDINSIPTDLVERIEIVTGGASAVYGSEAVAGVVNFILKDDFEGAEVNAQYGITGEGDGENAHASASVGANVADGRGNVALNIVYDKTKPIWSRNRELSAVDTTMSGTGAIRRPAFSAYGAGGQFYVGDFALNPDGTPFRSVVNGYNRNQDRLIQVPTERYLLSTMAHYDVTESLRWFFEGSYARTEARSNAEPIAFGDNTTLGVAPDAPILNIPVTNPFIPQALRSRLPADQEEIFFSRRFVELGDRVSDVTRQTFRFTTGFDGAIGETGFDWNAYYGLGRVTEDQESGGVFNVQRMQEALDAIPGPNGTAVCRDATARALGCVPINLFGAGAATGAGLDYVRASSTYDATVEQQTAGFSVTGKPFALPAGDLGVAAGVEWRKESSDTNFDPLTLAGLSSGNQAAATRGGYDVWEGFAEINVPILSGLPFVEYLGVNGAARYSDYSTVGGIWSYEAAAEYQPITDVRFRGSISRAVRAPNIAELYDPAQQTFESVNDPCAGVSATAQDPVSVNCRNTPGIREALARGGFNPTEADLASIPGFNSGNPELDAEKADTFTVGAVFTPTFVSGLTVSADFWNIKIKDAIQGIARQTAVNQCVAQQPYPGNIFCSTIRRDPATGLITGLDLKQQNVATQKARGVDLQLDYTANLTDFGVPGEWGSLNFNLVGTYLDKNASTAYAGAEPIEFAGSVGYSRYKANLRTTWDNGPLSLTYNVRYLSPANIDNESEFTNNRIPTLFYQDVQVRYDVTEGASVYAGVNNLMDRKPPLISSPFPVAITGTETAADVYDPVGRFFYAGIRAKF